MTSHGPVNRAIFLFYGDVIKSHGTAIYLSSFLKYMRHLWKETEALFSQVYLPNGDYCLKDPGLPKLSEAPLIKLYPCIPKIIWRFYELLYCYLKICSCLFRRGDNSVTTVFVCGEALLPVILLCKITGYKCVYVKMGIIEECTYTTKGLALLKYKIIHLLERHFLGRFEIITVVSEGMRRYLQQNYAISPECVSVLPCAVDQEVFGYKADSRPEIRRDLGLEGRLVFVYSGIWAPWQCIQETIACFTLLKEIDERAFFLILSPDREPFHQSLSCLNSEDYRVLFIEHSLMDRYLSCADCGFLIRKRHIINQVASPLKFSEYLICGLPIIIGPEVGDFSNMIQDEGIGVVIDPDQPEEWKKRLFPFLKQVSNDGESLKNNCYNLAVNRFSWQAVSQGLVRLQDQTRVSAKSPKSLED